MASFIDPSIEVFSESPRFELISRRLKQTGLRPIRVTGPLAEDSPIPLLVDWITRGDQSADFLKRLSCSTESKTRDVIVLGAAPNQINFRFAIIIPDLEKLESLPTRLAIRQREKLRQSEAVLRRKTAKNLGLESRKLPSSAAKRVLYLGDCSHDFLALKDALDKRGISVVAALSRITAADYLETGQFSVCIVTPGFEPSDAPGSGKSRINEITCGVRVCLFERTNVRFAYAKEAADDLDAIFDESAQIEDIAAEIEQFILQRPAASEQQSSENAFQYLRPGMVFSQEYLNTHLEHLIEETDELASQLSLISVRSAAGDAPIQEIAKTVGRLVRDTDLVAQINSDTLCIVMRSTPYRGAVSLGRRIDKASHDPLEWRAVERRQFHNVRTLLAAVSFPARDTAQRRA